MIFGILNNFSDEEYAAIGKAVWSYTVLEHELARAAMKLRFEVASANSSGPIDAHIKKITKAALAGRFNAFVTAMKVVHPDEGTAAWLREAESKFKDGLQWRDRICHGYWKRLEDGRLGVRLLDRQSVDYENEVDFAPLSIQDLTQITATTLSWSIAIAERAGTVPK